MLDWIGGQRLDDSIERPSCQGFVGREATLAELDRLLLDEETDRRVVVIGGPGMGKTAILENWLVRCEAARVAVPHHFIWRGRYSWHDPSAIARSIAAQIEDRYPAHRDPDARPETRLVELLDRVSARELVPSGRRLVLLVDGLDEYDVPTEVCDPLAVALPRALPRGVRFLCASQPRHPHLDACETRHGELVRLDLDDLSAADDNDATVRAFWRREAPGLGFDDRLVERAVLRANGNMQHAMMARNHLASVPGSESRVEAIPRGLPNLLAMLWQRVAGDGLAVRGLGILCAAREPLSLNEIGLVAGWSNIAEQLAFAHVARALLVKTRRSDGMAAYWLGHDSVRAYLVDQLGPRPVHRYREMLASKLTRRRAEELDQRRPMPAADEAVPVIDAVPQASSVPRHNLAQAVPAPNLPSAPTCQYATQQRYCQRKRASSRHVILFLAANPGDTGRLALTDECAAIERELQMAAHGDDFELRSKWGVTADEMARHLLQFEPTIVHFSGHGTGGAPGPSADRSRDVMAAKDSGIFLHGEQGRSRLMTARNLAKVIKSSAPSTRVVVLNACYSDRRAEELCSVVECVVGMAGAIQDDAARSFAVGFYRALGHRRSVGNAMDHAVATMETDRVHVPDEGVPRCRTRNWVDAHQIFL
jgi:hypothetical protein